MKREYFKEPARQGPSPVEEYVDPVCGMEAVGTAFEFVWEGRRFHFCSAPCLEDFRKDPERFGKTGGPPL